MCLPPIYYIVVFNAINVNVQLFTRTAAIYSAERNWMKKKWNNTNTHT